MKSAAVNQETRPVSLKVPLFTLCGVALLSFFPGGDLLGYIRGEIPAGTLAAPRQGEMGTVVAIDQASRGPVI